MPGILEHNAAFLAFRFHVRRQKANNYNEVFAITLFRSNEQEVIELRISRSSWDRWAPVLYLFIIGMALGFGIGLAVGSSSKAGSDLAYIALLPVVLIVIAFVILVIVSKRIGRMPKA
jgi:hypothetical protein